VKKAQEAILSSQQELDAAKKAAESMHQKAQARSAEQDVKEKDLVAREKKVRVASKPGETRNDP